MAVPRRGRRKYALAAGAGLIIVAATAYSRAPPNRLNRFSRDTSFRQRQSERRCGLPERWHHRQPHRQSVQLTGLKGEVEKCCPQIQERRHRRGPSRSGTPCGRRTDRPDRAAWRFAFHSRRLNRHSRQQRNLGREFRTQDFGNSQRPAGYYGPHFRQAPAQWRRQAAISQARDSQSRGLSALPERTIFCEQVHQGRRRQRVGLLPAGHCGRPELCAGLSRTGRLLLGNRRCFCRRRATRSQRPKPRH